MMLPRSFQITSYTALLVLAMSATTPSHGQSTSISAVQTSTQSLNVGDYFRPSVTEVSGFPGTTAAYRRSPCPALNTLANHGYLPRDG